MRSLKKNTRIGLVICISALGLFATILAYLIWQTTPFFNMQLVLLEASALLVIAALFVIVTMAKPDKER